MGEFSVPDVFANVTVHGEADDTAVTTFAEPFKAAAEQLAIVILSPTISPGFELNVITSAVPVNDAPVSLVDTIIHQIFQGESIDLDRNIDAKLVKDVDNTLNQLSIVLIDQPKLGNVIISQTPRLSYNSPVLKTGLDQFYVVFSDGINQSKSIPFIIRVLSKKRNPLDPEVRVYPNPSRDFFQINNIIADKWEIRSADGRLVMQSGILHNLNHFSISLNSLPKGSYLLYLYKEKRVIVIKRIVLN